MKATSFEQLRTESSKSSALPNTKILSALTADKSFMDRFYLSGYEGLCLALNHRDLTKTIISSAVPFEGELLVIGNSDACDLWFQVCAEMRIRMSFIDINERDIVEAASTVFSVNSRISHVLCSTQCSVGVLKEVGRLAHAYRCALIADNTGDDLTMGDIEKIGVDFTIAASDDREMPVSIIVARRSRLVMTEGNARHADHDLYAIWQSTLSTRDSTWVPMS